jgi:tetratricopeptide (TPR) repeat protein
MTRPTGAIALFVLMVSLPTGFGSGAAAQVATGSMDAEARSLFEAGQLAFRDGRFADALADFERAHTLSHRPELLYNIGQCHDHLRHDAEALASFEAYLSAVPDAPARPIIESRIAILREAIASAAVEPTAPPEPNPAPTVPSARPDPEVALPAPAAPDDAPTAADPTGWVLVGVGGAVAVGGGLLLGVALSDIAAVESASGVPYSSVRDANERAPILSGVGWAALGVGVAALGVGLALTLTSGGAADTRAARLRLGPGSLTVEGSF